MCVSLDQGWYLKSSPVLGTTPMREKGGLGLHKPLSRRPWQLG